MRLPVPRFDAGSSTRDVNHRAGTAGPGRGLCKQILEGVRLQGFYRQWFGSETMLWQSRACSAETNGDQARLC